MKRPKLNVFVALFLSFACSAFGGYVHGVDDPQRIGGYIAGAKIIPENVDLVTTQGKNYGTVKVVKIEKDFITFHDGKKPFRLPRAWLTEELSEQLPFIPTAQ